MINGYSREEREEHPLQGSLFRQRLRRQVGPLSGMEGPGTAGLSQGTGLSPKSTLGLRVFRN
jgi:hypothetical protein